MWRGNEWHLCNLFPKQGKGFVVILRFSREWLWTKAIHGSPCFFSPYINNKSRAFFHKLEPNPCLQKSRYQMGWWYGFLLILLISTLNIIAGLIQREWCSSWELVECWRPSASVQLASHPGTVVGVQCGGVLLVCFPQQVPYLGQGREHKTPVFSGQTGFI